MRFVVAAASKNGYTKKIHGPAGVYGQVIRYDNGSFLSPGGGEFLKVDANGIVVNFVTQVSASPLSAAPSPVSAVLLSVAQDGAGAGAGPVAGAGTVTVAGAGPVAWAPLPISPVCRLGEPASPSTYERRPVTGLSPPLSPVSWLPLLPVSCSLMMSDMQTPITPVCALMRL